MVRWSQSKEARLSPIHFESSRSKYSYPDDVRHLDGRMQFVDPQKDLDLGGSVFFPDFAHGALVAALTAMAGAAEEITE